MEMIDKIFSGSWQLTLIIIVVLFLFVGLAFLNPFKNKTINFFYKGLMYAIPVVGLTSLHFTHFGFATGFDKILFGKNVICLYETYERGNGEGPDESVCRIHIIDKNTGVKKDRIYTGAWGNLTGMRNDTICYLNENDLYVIDGNTSREIYHIKMEEWGAISPELNAGLVRISDNQNSDRTIIPYIVLDCKNGKTYYFDPFSKNLLSEEPKKTTIRDFVKKDYELCIEPDESYNACFLKTQSSKNAHQRECIVPYRENSKMFHVTDSSDFIDPFLMCIDTVKKVFVFGHYTTTDRKDFLIQAKNFEFKTLWKKTTSELGAVDSYGSPSCKTWKYFNNILYFNCGGFILAINPLTSKITWKTRL